MTSAGVAGPCLQVIAQDGTVGRAYPISEQQFDIGRTDGDIILPDDRFVCPRHARLTRDGTRVTIQDLASVNGIYKKLQNPIPLEHGDVFLVGLAVLKFEVLAPGEQHLRGAIERGTQVFGSPPSPRYARISEQTMEGVLRSIFVVTREETILGREVGDIVFSSDPFMSRRHAAITRNSSDGRFSLLDLGSSNGTFIRIRGQADLASGDHVRIGQHLFRCDLNNGQVPGQGQAQAR
jgi:pSer/pThr/pTyr-binding forkhead associated (FHA) protein